MKSFKEFSKSLNESFLDNEFKQSFKQVLDDAKSSKTTSELKTYFVDRLSEFEESYKKDLKDYLDSKYDKSWFEEFIHSLAEDMISPGVAVTNLATKKSDDTVSTAVSSAKDNFDDERRSDVQMTLEKLPFVGTMVKTIDKLVFNSGDSSTQVLVDVLYKAGVDAASKIFEASLKEVGNLENINFDFESIEAKINKNKELLDRYKEEIEKLEENEIPGDWNKMLEMYCFVNILRTQQTALLAISQEYEFLSGNLKNSFLRDISPYLQAAFEVGVSILTINALIQLVGELGKTDAWNKLESDVYSSVGTLIPGLSDALKKVGDTVGEAFKSQVVTFLSSAVIVILRGSQIALDKDFSDRNRYMQLALTQYAPLITAGTTILNYCNSVYDNVNTAFSKDIPTAFPVIYNSLSEDQRSTLTELAIDNASTNVYTFTVNIMKSPENALKDVLNSMEIADTYKSVISYDAIEDSDIRGKSGFFSFMDSVGLGGDWMKNLQDIFDDIESPITSDLEDEISDLYTSYVNKQDPLFACLGGLIFIDQTNAIISNWQKIFAFDKLTNPPIVEVNDLGNGDLIPANPFEVTNEAPEFEFDEYVDSCGVYVSVLDKDLNVYKSKIGDIYFETGSSIIADDKPKTGLVNFQDLLNRYELYFHVIGNADVAGPQDKIPGRTFIGNLKLSENRAKSFIEELENIKFDYSAIGRGKKYARKFTKYIGKSNSTTSIAKIERMNLTELKAQLALDRRIEIVIFFDEPSYEAFNGREDLIEKVCLFKVEQSELKMIGKNKTTKKYDLILSNLQSKGISVNKLEGPDNRPNESLYLSFLEYVKSLNG
jgi:flagellar motor protein MotB